jgi:hypothetical protein
VFHEGSACRNLLNKITELQNAGVTFWTERKSCNLILIVPLHNFCVYLVKNFHSHIKVITLYVDAILVSDHVVFLGTRNGIFHSLTAANYISFH